MENIWETDGNSFVNHGKKTIDYGNYGRVMGSWDLNGHQYDRDVKFD